MKRLLFGISGLPYDSGVKSMKYAQAIPFLKGIGLDAMELLFVQSVNVSDKNKDEILQAKKDNDFYLSAHGSYYINLNSVELEKQEQSLGRIVKGAEGLAKVEGRSLIFHPGFYGAVTPEETYATIRDNLMKLPHQTVDYRLETTGKASQFGTVEELVALCKEVPSCKLCIDFSHVHARNGGCLKGYEDFANILRYVKKELGQKGLDDLHMHISGIAYTAKGEKNHLPLLESDFNYIACMQALKDFKVKGCVICESPILEKDALLLKSTYDNLS